MKTNQKMKTLLAAVVVGMGISASAQALPCKLYRLHTFYYPAVAQIQVLHAAGIIGDEDHCNGLVDEAADIFRDLPFSTLGKEGMWCACDEAL